MSVGKVVINNKKVNYEYEIVYTLEAGLVLYGAEVKSLRDGKASFNDSFIQPNGNEVFIHSFYISPYEHMSSFKLVPTRVRKLLLNKKEINKLIGHVKKDGVTIVPTKLYFNHKNFVKLEIAVVKGKKRHDKRRSIKEREWGRKKQGILKHSVNDS